MGRLIEAQLVMIPHMSVPERSVVLVEDSDDDAFFFERAFSKAGLTANVIRIKDGGAAVEHLKSSADNLPALIFLDLKLPVLSGFDVLKWMREHNVFVEVIVLSGSDLDSDKRLARELGASDYLVKPVSAAELNKRLNGKAVQTGHR